MASRAPSTYSRTDSATSSTGRESISSSPRSRATRYPFADRSPAQRAAGVARSPAQRAPSSPARAAHFAPLPVAERSGPIGRRPLGPDRNISVTTAPTAAPRSAAVRRSNCCSRPSSVFVSRTDARARLLPLGAAFNVSGIQLLLLIKCFMNSGAHSTQRGCGSHERPFGLFLNYSHQGVHFLDSLFSHFER